MVERNMLNLKHVGKLWSPGSKRVVYAVVLVVCLIFGYHIVLNSIFASNGVNEQLNQLRNRLNEFNVSSLEELYYSNYAKYAETIGPPNWCREIEADPELMMQCDAKFYPTLEENLEKIKSYPTEHAKTYLQRFENSIFIRKPAIDPRIIPVFVTAASSNHAQEVLNNIKSVHELILPANPGAKYIFYDLGVTDEEREIIANACKCEVRTFPFSDYPDHVRDLHTFAWKPLIIQTLLSEFGAVFWMDASIRFRYGNISAMLMNAQKYGICIYDTGLAFPPPTLTDPRTFLYLGEPRCLYKDLGMVEANAMLVVLSNFSWTAIMKPWLACALARDCMAPEGSSTGCGEYMRRLEKKMFTCCHRQDQSALSIILNRLYQFSLHRELYIPEVMLDVIRT